MIEPEIAFCDLQVGARGAHTHTRNPLHRTQVSSRCRHRFAQTHLPGGRRPRNPACATACACPMRDATPALELPCSTRAPPAPRAPPPSPLHTLQDDMRCAEDYVRYCCRWVLDHCQADLDFITKMYDATVKDRLTQVGRARRPGATLVARLAHAWHETAMCSGCNACGAARKPGLSPFPRLPRAPCQVAASPFARCSYTEAIEKLEEAIKNGRKFENPVSHAQTHSYAYSCEWMDDSLHVAIGD